MSLRFYNEILGALIGVSAIATSLLLPLIGAIAVISTYIRSVRDGEIAILYSSGVSPFQLLTPALCFGLMILVVNTFLALVVAPAGTGILQDIIYSIRSGTNPNFMRPGLFHAMNDGRTVLSFDRWGANGDMEGVFIWEQATATEERVVKARAARFLTEGGRSRIVLLGGTAVSRGDDFREAKTVFFDRIVNDVGNPTGGASPKREWRGFAEYGFFELISADRLRMGPHERKQYFSEISKRLFLPWTTLAHIIFFVSFLLTGGTALNAGRRAASIKILAAVVILHIAFVLVSDTLNIRSLFYFGGVYALLVLEVGLGLSFLMLGRVWFPTELPWRRAGASA